ncbi:Uma2 family endonuclease [Streptomyces sp. URMC 124]|uniref:Uma2 family endonuclease n=1 Tax=Streptomyces sp. URMC 124 TaxID=3423405 RepID=UPI003F1D7833
MPEDHFVGQGEWASPEGVLMTTEVTSRDSDTDLRDRKDKRDGYAAADIPVYLLIDRDACMVTVYSDPRNGKYLSRVSHPYGDTVKLPDPVGITLATEKLKDYTH